MGDWERYERGDGYSLWAGEGGSQVRVGDLQKSALFYSHNSELAERTDHSRSLTITNPTNHLTNRENAFPFVDHTRCDGERSEHSRIEPDNPEGSCLHEKIDWSECFISNSGVPFTKPWTCSSGRTLRSSAVE